MNPLQIDIRTLSATELFESQEIQDQWSELLCDSSMPISSFLPSLTMGMLKHLPQYKNTRVLLLSTNINSDSQLLGIFPYQLSRYSFFSPKAYISMQNGFFGNGLPLIRQGYEEVVWEHFLDHLQQTPGLPDICYLQRIACEGESYQALEKILKQSQRAFHFSDQFQRAAIASDLPFAEYQTVHYSKKSKKTASELRRQLRRLSELGEVQFDYCTDPIKNVEHLATFLDLENKGWKGKRGTSLACDEHRVKMLNELISAPVTNPTYGFFILTLDEKVIAIGLNYIAAKCLVTVKMAYDEEFRTYAPGLLLSWKTLEYTLDNDDIKYINSNTIAGDVLEKIWIQKLQTGSIFLSANPNKNTTFERHMKFETLRLDLRNSLKKNINLARKKLSK